MTTANQGLEAMIAKCESLLGTAGRPNTATRWYAARNGAYYANAPWCNMFITWAAYHSGNHNAVCFGRDYAYTVYHAQRFQQAGQWHPDVTGIRRGDIVFFDWAGSNHIAAIDHVGIVTDVNGRDILTIEGNTADRCARRVRRQEEIVGYGRPAYVASPVSPPPKTEASSVEPAHNYARTTYGGRTVNQRTKVMLETAAQLFGRGFSLTQGSYSTGVSASAGTHDGGGVVDIDVDSLSSAQRDAAVQALRKAGFFAWLRVPPAFDYHIHAVAIGDREMSAAAKSQVVQGFQDRDGLARRGPDPAPDPYPAWTAKYGTHVSPDTVQPPPSQPPPPRPAPTPYTPPAFPAGLKPNSTKPSARGLQRALKAAGYLSKSVAESDNYGPLTQAAVKRFHARNPQYAEGPADPVIGPRGWAELHREAYA